MKKISIAFYWHMHQPSYKDMRSGELTAPWVRLHAIKDYYDMMDILNSYPSLKQTFNVTPVLLEQLLEYANKGLQTSEVLLQTALKPINEMDDSDKLKLLDEMFLGNYHTMIKPYKRYNELWNKKEFLRREEGKLAGNVHRFSEQEILDLICLHELVWFDPDFRTDPFLKSMFDKGGNFTEEDKRRIFEKEFEIIRKIVPLYKEMAEKGKVELTTTPFFHPILPLLCDTNLARVASPDLPLPKRRFSHREDAEAQVKMALDYFESIFGFRPKGMWPSEGSVGEVVVPIFASNGVKWIASDEEILSKSLGIKDGKDRAHIYEPYVVKSDKGNVEMIFRDHILSDLIGFSYKYLEAETAAKDFLKRVHDIKERLSDKEHALISVILDGENAWQDYPNDGKDFLNALYTAIEDDDEVETVTVNEYLDRYPPTKEIHHLFTGSWIFHNLETWIGEEEENDAWDLLGKARDELERVQREGKISEENLRMAWKEMYAAEGSDWFWWFGDDQDSGRDWEYDEEFRRHLMNVYYYLGETIPLELYKPIIRVGKVLMHKQPRGLFDIIVDGEETNYFEWLDAGVYDLAAQSGDVMKQVSGKLDKMYYGFDSKISFLNLRIDLDKEFFKKEGKGIRILLNVKGEDFMVDYTPSKGCKFIRADGSNVEIEGRYTNLFETRIPLSEIDVKPDDTITVVVVLVENEVEIERRPEGGFLDIKVPTRHLEEIMWIV